MPWMAIATTAARVASTVGRVGAAAARTGAGTAAKQGVETGVRNAAAQMAYGAVSHIAGKKNSASPDEDQAYR